MLAVRPTAFAAITLLSFLTTTLKSLVALNGTTPPPQTKSVLFEIASIKPSRQNEPFAQQLLPDGFLLHNGSVQRLINLAYEPAKVSDRKGTEAGPEWIRHDGIDVLAKVSSQEAIDWQRETTSEYNSSTFKHALQQLLAERCSLQVHTVTTETDGFALVLNPSAHKAALVPSTASVQTAIKSLPASGDPIAILPGGIVHFENQPLSRLANFISKLSTFKVEDKTGLAGTYTFSVADRQPVHLTSSDEEDYRLPVQRWDLRSTGLRIVRSKVHQSVVVIDHIERPSPN